MPLQELKKSQEAAVEAKRNEIAAVVAAKQESVSKYTAEGTVVVEYAGFGERKFSTEMQRSFGLGRNQKEEVDITISAVENSYKIEAKWQTRMPDQPVVVDIHHSKDGSIRGLLFSFGTQDEGPTRLCAVAEWYGEAKGKEVEEKQDQMLKYLRMDKCASAVTHAHTHPGPWAASCATHPSRALA
jgi:hypothetical protein